MTPELNRAIYTRSRLGQKLTKILRMKIRQSLKSSIINVFQYGEKQSKIISNKLLKMGVLPINCPGPMALWPFVLVYFFVTNTLSVSLTVYS